MNALRNELQKVHWRDLVELTPLEKAWELSLCLPWLGLSLWFYAQDWWWLGTGASFYLFDSDEEHRFGRTQRGTWINALSYSMFFHAEHHLFPAVPTTHLAELSQRLDRAAPQISAHQVLP